MPYVPASTRYDRPAFYRPCGRSGLKLPAISLGLWHNFGGVDPFENGRAIVRRAFDRGVTHFDLANNYGPPPGSAEEAMGRILDLDLKESNRLPRRGQQPPCLFKCLWCGETGDHVPLLLE